MDHTSASKSQENSVHELSYANLDAVQDYVTVTTALALCRMPALCALSAQVETYNLLFLTA